MIALALSLFAAPTADRDKFNMPLMGFMCAVESAAPADLFFVSFKGTGAENEVHVQSVNPPAVGRAYSWPKTSFDLSNALHGVDTKKTDVADIASFKISGVPGIDDGEVSLAVTFPKRASDGSWERPSADTTMIIGSRQVKAHCTFVPPAPSPQETK